VYGCFCNTLEENESYRLYHEMWHAYQFSIGVSNSFNSNGMNNEIEARYAQYLYISSLPEYKEGSKWEKRWSNEMGRKQVAKLADRIDSHGNLKTGQSGDSLNSYLINDVQGAIRQSNPEYSETNYPYNLGREGSENFKNLQELSKGC